MSYLRMPSAPVPDMKSGIISFWFRDIAKQATDQPVSPSGLPSTKPPAAVVWPQGFWTEANSGTVMVPPNAQYSIGYDPDYKNCEFFYNPYGLPIGAEFFGDAFLGAAPVWIPNSPPVPLNTMSSTGSAIAGVADADMSKYGIRTLLTFGDQTIPYEYCTWAKDVPNVLDAVIPSDSFGFVIYWDAADNGAPPYPPHSTAVGDGGKFHIRNYKLNGPTNKGTVPPSFIGIDNDGHIVINLQTKTKATCKGMSFVQSKIKELWAWHSFLQIDGPPYSYSEIGWPFPDGHWYLQGPYWQGYQFEYEDVSDKIMGCAPESFVIYARTIGLFDFAFGSPTIRDGGWHHILFSFDISGSVTTDQTDPSAPVVATNCKAWLAFDDKNITGTDLQNRPPVHDGFLLPKLRGTETTQILDCGPATAYARGADLGDNTILPRNAWLHGWGGNPKDNLASYASLSSPITDDDDLRNGVARQWGGIVGDFNWQDFTGAIWPLYGHGVAPGPWQGIFDPKHPDVPDPATFDAPSYSCSGFTIPVNGHPIGIPCGSGPAGFPDGSGTITDYNTGVEMAELQIWANKTLDTGQEGLRRLFLDYPKDDKGNPDKSKPLQPVPPGTAEKVLGKPDILLHGSGNWKNGRNTGTSGFMPNSSDTNPKGQFQQVATIEKFVPEPKLGV